MNALFDNPDRRVIVKCDLSHATLTSRSPVLSHTGERSSIVAKFNFGFIFAALAAALAACSPLGTAGRFAESAADGETTAEPTGRRPAIGRTGPSVGVTATPTPTVRTPTPTPSAVATTASPEPTPTQLPSPTPTPCPVEKDLLWAERIQGATRSHIWSESYGHGCKGQGDYYAMPCITGTPLPVRTRNVLTTRQGCEPKTVMGIGTTDDLLHTMFNIQNKSDGENTAQVARLAGDWNGTGSLTVIKNAGVLFGNGLPDYTSLAQSLPGSPRTLSGDIVARSGGELRLSEQAEARWGASTVQWPCGDYDRPEHVGRFFAVGRRYVVRTEETISLTKDYDWTPWFRSTYWETVRAVAKDGSGRLIRRKTVWPELYVLTFGDWQGIGATVWSGQLRAFVRVPTFGEWAGTVEVITEDDLDALPAESPCGSAFI